MIYITLWGVDIWDGQLLSKFMVTNVRKFMKGQGMILLKGWGY